MLSKTTCSTDASVEAVHRLAFSQLRQGELRKSLAQLDALSGQSSQSNQSSHPDSQASSTPRQDPLASSECRGGRLGSLTFLHRTAIAIELGEEPTPVIALREILARPDDSTVAFLAASCLTRHYRFEGPPRLARFYARVARRVLEKAASSGVSGASGGSQADRSMVGGERSSSSEARRRLAGALYVEGLLDLAAQRLSDAQDHLRRARRSVGPSESELGVLVASLLAYSHCLAGRDGEAEALYLELTDERRLGWLEPKLASRLYGPSIDLNLGFTALELKRFDEAWGHGRRALERLHRQEGRTAIRAFKHGLFLLGECCCGAGREEDALRWFGRLTTEFYPEAAVEAEMLVRCAGHRWLNWLA